MDCRKQFVLFFYFGHTIVVRQAYEVKKMDPIVLVSILVGLVLILLVVGAPVKPLRLVGNLAVKFIVGALMLFFVNAFGTMVGLQIPINGVTTAVAGILGVPGVVLLIVVKQFLI